jgi:FkbM family methyltransferase
VNGLLVQHDGFWWPASDQNARPVITGDCAEAVARMLGHVSGRDCIVQAGANVGVYPLALADHFAEVITCEPDLTNFECLRKNLAARDSLGRVIVGAEPAAWGDAAGICAPVEVQALNCGAHRVDFGSGPVRVLTIDSLLAGALACDAIWLDIEGSELAALKGGAATIERFSPVIAVEDKGLHRAFGVEDGALQAWLAERGYVEIDRIGNDKVFRRNP